MLDTCRIERILVALVLWFLSPGALCFVPRGTVLNTNCGRDNTGVALLAASKEPVIDFQSDDTKFGRGDFHLSASLNDGDVVVYQIGTWHVDGVQVGDGSPATWCYARVETIQIVWTHNCEHGVIRGVALEPVFCQDSLPVLKVSDEQVEMGPEQLVARIPVEWNDSLDEGHALVVFDESSWSQHAEIV